MDKLNRNYLLRVQAVNGEIIEVGMPFSIEFDILRNDFASASNAQIRVYNLGKQTRAAIRKDEVATNVFRKIELKAGYGNNIPFVFVGNILKAWSVREGVNFITYIEAQDMGFAYANGFTNQSFSQGTPYQDIIEKLMKSLPAVDFGAAGDFPGAISRGNSYSGNTADLLNALTGGAFFISNGKSYCLNDDECIQGSVEQIDSNAGLLNTPTRELKLVKIEMIFEPRLTIAQKIFLDSSTGDNVNGFYKVVSISHKAMISPVVCGSAITKASLFPGDQLLEVV